MSHFMSPEDLLKKLGPVAEKYIDTEAPVHLVKADCYNVIAEEFAAGHLPEGVEVEVYRCDNVIDVRLDTSAWKSAWHQWLAEHNVLSEEDENMNNIVIIVHQGDPNLYYMFSVPRGVQLRKGDTVVAKTRRGKRDGTCACDSFEVADGPLSVIASRFGARLPLNPVIGRATVVPFGVDDSTEKLKIENETLRLENERLRGEIDRLHRENFWLTSSGGGGNNA